MKYKIQKSIFLSVFFIGLMTILFTACEKKAVQFGEQFVDNNYTQVIETDTLTPFVSTLYIDSFVTSNTGSAIIGYTNDPQFGTLQASAFFQLATPSYNAASTEYVDARFDSITVFAKINKSLWYGDTTKPLKLNVFRLDSNILLPVNQTAFYNTSSVKTQPTSLGSYSFRLMPNALDSVNDTLSIRLSDAIGQELFNKLQTGDFNIQSTDQFLPYFKGLKISADPTSDLSFSISDSIEMRVYYTKAASPQVEEKFVSFPMTDATKQFNNITINRSGLLPQQNFGIAHNNIASSQTGNSAFLNPMANAMIKITFPTLNRVLQEYFIKVTRAVLQIFPAQTSSDNNNIFVLPKTLNLATTDLNNGIGTPLTSAGGTGAQTGNLNFSDPTASGPYYVFDLTAAITQFLNDPSTQTSQKGLLLIPPSTSMFNTFNRLIIGDANNQNAKMKLTIDYISIK